MPPPGRPRHIRGVYSIEDPPLLLPAEVLIDTSFVVEGLVRTQPRHNAARDFLWRLLESGTTLYYNRLLEIELAETAFRIALEERFGRTRREEARRDGRARQRAGRLMEEARSAWRETLAAFPSVRIELDEVAETAPELMRRYGLRSNDAVHVATAIYASVRDAVTLDVGFACVPASVIRLFTTAHRLGPCRQRRGGS